MGRLLRFLAANVWVFISIPMVGYAVWLAEDTYYAKRGSPPVMNLALTYSSGAVLGEPTVVVIIHDDDSLGFAMLGSAKPGTRVLLELGDLDENRSCNSMGSRKLEFSKHTEPGYSGKYAIPVGPIVGSEGLDVRCTLTAKVFHETFVTRRMEFQFSRYLAPPAGCPLKCEVASYVLDFSLIPRFAHPEFIGGEPMGERKRRLKTDDPFQLSLSWEDEISAQRRDLRLVMIGLIVAVAAGAFIEWARPRIDEWRTWGRAR